MLKKKYLNLKLQPQANKTIICFHGIFNDANSNTPVEELAHELGYNYLSYTFPMHGDNLPKIKVTLDELIQTAIDVVKASPTKKIILFGHSAGANWVNSCINYFGDDHFEKAILIAPINASLKLIDVSRLKTLEKLLFRQKVDFEKIVDEFRNISLLFHDYTSNQAIQYINLMNKFCSKKFLYQTNLTYEKTKLPILVIAGQDDMVIDTNGSKTLFNFINPNIQFHVMGGCGHAPHFDERETFKKLAKEFLHS